MIVKNISDKPVKVLNTSSEYVDLQPGETVIAHRMVFANVMKTGSKELSAPGVRKLKPMQYEHAIKILSDEVQSVEGVTGKIRVKKGEVVGVRRSFWKMATKQPYLYDVNQVFDEPKLEKLTTKTEKVEGNIEVEAEPTPTPTPKPTPKPKAKKKRKKRSKNKKK